MRSIFKMLRSTVPNSPGDLIQRPAGDHFPIYLGLGVNGHGVCLHPRQIRELNYYSAVPAAEQQFNALGLLDSSGTGYSLLH
jgi:hypothetical protein